MSASIRSSSVGCRGFGFGAGFAFAFTGFGSTRLRRGVELGAPPDVIGPAAVVRAQPAVFDGQRALGHGIQQGAVVGDEQDRSGKGLERGLERLAALEVEVVRGLVEDEEVGPRRDDEREREASSLAAGEHRDRLLLLLPAREEEAAEKVLRVRSP